MNLFGGPGAGKSATASGIFYVLKRMGINCELITEYTKGKVWEQSFKILENQLYILAKQKQQEFRVKDQVDVLITDAPLFLSMYYGKSLSNAFKEIIRETFDENDNLNFLIERRHKYDPVGRIQKSEGEANTVHNGVREVLDREKIEYKVIYTQPEIEDFFVIGDEVKTIVKDVLKHIKECNI